jgi:hypothetical protein
MRESRAYGADEVAARNAHAAIWKGALIAPRVSEMALPAEPRQKLVQPDVIVT